jgi:hypothetical protein
MSYSTIYKGYTELGAGIVAMTESFNLSINQLYNRNLWNQIPWCSDGSIQVSEEPYYQIAKFETIKSSIEYEKEWFLRYKCLQMNCPPHERICQKLEGIQTKETTKWDLLFLRLFWSWYRNALYTSWARVRTKTNKQTNVLRIGNPILYFGVINHLRILRIRIQERILHLGP